MAHKLDSATTGIPNALHSILELNESVLERENAEAALQAAEARHRKILESIPMPVYTTDAEGRITFYNPAAVKFAGREPRIGDDRWCISWKISTLNGETLPHEDCPFAVALREGTPRLGIDEAIAETPDGQHRRFMPFATPLQDDDGQVVGGLNVLVDVTHIRSTERALARRVRQQASLYRFTDRLYRAESTEAVHEAALDAITEALECDRASILLMDAKGVMRFTAWRGLSDAYRQAVEGHSPWKADEVDPQPIWVADIEHTEEPEAIKQVVLAEGIRGLGFIPILAGGRLAGKFMVYYRDAHEFTGEETELAVILARQLGFSIEQRRAEARRAEAEELLRDREQRLSSMFENAGVGMVLMQGDCAILSANSEFCRISGRSLEELVGSSCLSFTHPDDLERNLEAANAVASGSSGVSFEKRYIRPDNRDLWVRINLNRVGKDQVLAVVEDIDARHRAEEQKILLLEERSRAETRMREQAEEFYALADNIPTLCWMAYADGHIYWYNRRWYEYTGTSLETLEGWGWEAVHDPEVLPKVLERWKHSLATGEPFEMTFPIRGADGEFRPFLTRVVPIRDESGAIRRWFGTNTDVTVQARHQEHLQLLINELNHRVKNTLATVQSMAVRSLRNAPSQADGLDAFEGRLLALSRAHNLLTSSNWEGADLHVLVTNVLEPFVSLDGDKLSVGGPAVWLSQRAAISLTMVLHELATNATKYGALASERGTLSIEWSSQSEDGDHLDLELTWLERGMTDVRVPERRGFGSQLIERTIRSELNGSLDLAYEPSGLSCRLRATLERGGLGVGNGDIAAAV